MEKPTINPSSNEPATSATTGNTASSKPLYELVAKQTFFSGMNPKQLEKLADSALHLEFNPGERIFREGDQANRFFIILEGKVVLECEGEDGAMITIQTLGPGDDLGWSWLFQPYYLHFSARAVEPTNAIFFYGSRLREQCEEDNVLGYELMKRVAEVVVRRLEATQRQLSGVSGEKRYRD